MSNHDVVIVGGGPAGLAAGLYTSRMNLKTLLLDRGPLGGQLLNTELVEDYPGYESILGTELATKMGDHARKFGLDVREFEPVKEIDKEGTTKVIRLESGDEIRTPALIMAAGGLPRYLGVAGEKELWGRGVSYCAVCDGAFFKGQELAVVGGGDAAVEEGDFLTRYAKKVYILHRRGQLRAQPILIDRARANPKIEFILEAGVKEIVGNGKVQAVKYEQFGANKELPVGGVFIFIGFVPNSGLFKFHVNHDEGGYIITDRNLQTSEPGIWAVGDVRQQLTKQIATAVGSQESKTDAEETGQQDEVGEIGEVKDVGPGPSNESQLEKEHQKAERYQPEPRRFGRPPHRLKDQASRPSPAAGAMPGREWNLSAFLTSYGRACRALRARRYPAGGLHGGRTGRRPRPPANGASALGNLPG